ncbi:methyltransferase [Rhodococcus sp. IEGM 1381]|uniref:RraA family protein n=1 Tax=Rhodococcus sp. IEGM 1381 TaxID=3047085 RepID=UPI0024B63C49|nr:methyltransferase [Rhodococcus sp. IEGM 1381]MDI9894165.1 methyltransferase [Rhodococcus sp. IEGM 1381]
MSTETYSATAVSDDMIDRFSRVPAANVGDAQERFGIIAGLRPIWAGAAVTGRAYTVWTRSGDNLYIHKALDDARPGDVIVVNGSGDDTRALIGDLIGIRAKSLGIAGFVIDGAVRDADALAELGLPVFARSVTPAGPYKNGPGRLNEPVALGGVVVSPGDVIVADADGVVVVKSSDVDVVIVAAEDVVAREASKRESFSAGLR